MFDKAEQEYSELKRKKDVVENDKRKIEEVRQAGTGKGRGGRKRSAGSSV